MLTPFPTQISGASFLSSRKYALLADEPRVGKTGTAILAADDNYTETVLVVTTASGRAVWKRAWPAWSCMDLKVDVLSGRSGKLKPDVARIIVSWGDASNPTVRAELMKRDWQQLILDESHYAKNFGTKRTQAVYGKPLEDGRVIANKAALAACASGTWCLTGTPIPNAPNDLYPMLRALCPERLAADEKRNWPDVRRQDAFLRRYCVVAMKKMKGFRRTPVVVGGRNLEELRDRLGDFMLRRTQADVGIRQPIYETFPLLVTPGMRREADGDADREKVLAAAEKGDTSKLTMELGPKRRVTGAIKAYGVVDAIKDEFAGGLDKIVLAYWHRDTGDILRAGLSAYGVVGINGSTTPDERGMAVAAFSAAKGPRVFLGQIQAAGEAIDLSAAAELLFVETSLIPKDMKQMSLRITNHTQTRQPRVRVAVLEGSIDEVSEEILMRKWTTIREVMSDAN